MNTPKKRTSSLALAVVTGVAVASAGCASGGTYKSGTIGESASRTISLRVRNQNWQDVRVYLVRESGGVHTRIGSVPGLGIAVLRVRNIPPGHTRFLLRPIGSRAEFLTNPVFVTAGQTLELIVQSSLRLSSLVVW